MCTLIINYPCAWAPAGIFPGGRGQTFGVGPQKSVKGGPPYFFRLALKYTYRGGGVVKKPAEFFLGASKSIKVDLQNLSEGRYILITIYYTLQGCS